MILNSSKSNVLPGREYCENCDPRFKILSTPKKTRNYLLLQKQLSFFLDVHFAKMQTCLHHHSKVRSQKQRPWMFAPIEKNKFEWRGRLHFGVAIQITNAEIQQWKCKWPNAISAWTCAVSSCPCCTQWGHERHGWRVHFANNEHMPPLLPTTVCRTWG